jgi:hypothetical protein
MPLPHVVPLYRVSPLLLVLGVRWLARLTGDGDLVDYDPARQTLNLIALP